MKRSGSTSGGLKQSGAARKRRYEQAMKFKQADDGSRQQTHVRMDVYVPIDQVELLSKLARKAGGRKHLMQMLIKKHLEKARVELPDCGDERWRRLAVDSKSIFSGLDPINFKQICEFRELIIDSLERYKETD